MIDLLPYQLPSTPHTNHFFKDQIGHLMIAVSEASSSSRSGKDVVPFGETTGIHKQIEWLKSQSAKGLWVTCEEISIGAGVVKRSVAANLSVMRERNIKFKMRKRGNKPEYILG